MDFQRHRRLHHIYPEGKPLFITWHLHGSLPHSSYPPPGKLNAGQAFVWIDRYLDSTRDGPLYLRQEPIAQLVVGAIRYGAEQLQHYDLHAFVVMANHVHLLVLPRANPSRFLQSVKGYTAREANRLLGRTGQPFWQAESYDHWVRDGRESDRIRTYIENNPVRAGLVANAEDYPWSSAGRKAERTLGSAALTGRATDGVETEPSVIG
jgi:REP element-mobilizing transposase RayT